MNAFLKRQNLRLPLPKSPNSNSLTWQKIIIALVILMLCIGFLTIFQSPIKNTFYYATSPLLNIFKEAGQSTSTFLGGLFNGASKTQENKNLKEENQRLLSQIFTLQENAKQYQAIKEIAQATQSDNFKLVIAQALNLDTFNDSIIINKGSDDGIYENMPVISSTKVLYGKISKVYKNFSQVALISKKNSVVDVKIYPVKSASQNEAVSSEGGQFNGVKAQDAAENTVLGAVKGSGNLSLYLDLVSSDSKINEGDTIVTSGLERIFPKDLLIGSIISIDKNDLKPFQTARLQSFFDIKSTDNLFIITDYLKR